MKRLLVVLTCLVLAAGGGVRAQTAKEKERVEALIKVIKTSKDAKQRAGAANEIADIGQVRLVLARPAEAALIDAMKDDSPEVRGAAARTLTLFEPYKKDRIPNLLGLLKDGEPRDTRINAITMLGQTEGGAKEAIPLLEEIVKKEADKAENMRDGDLINRSNQALVGIRQHLLGGYIATLKDDKDAKQRATAAAELAKIAQLNVEQAKPAIPVLVGALSDDNVDVRRSAIAALGAAKPDPPTILPGLIAIVKNIREDKAVKLTAIGMLTALGPNAQESLPFLEFLHGREGKKDEKDRDKELYDKLTQAIAAIKK
jgi:HEAT repeat protein